jgi:hypothetical protein
MESYEWRNIIGTRSITPDTYDSWRNIIGIWRNRPLTYDITPEFLNKRKNPVHIVNNFVVAK